ncbi:MAG: AAA family ATPase [Polyangiaceae bacterium]
MPRMVQAHLEPGAVVDSRYEVVRPLATGGLGSVFEARDRVFQRPVALKALRFESPAAIDAFRREFSLLTSCAHPRLARAFDFGRTTFAGAPLTYSTTELVVGTTLRDHARGRRLELVLPALADALDALAWLHAAGIVHGDVKPDNVLVREDGSGVLIDLSAARRGGAGSEELSGTVRYLAPEVLSGGAPTARSDLFALGRTLDDLLALAEGSASEAIRRLTARLGAGRPADRPGVEEVLELLAHEGVARSRAAVVAGGPAELLGRDGEVRAFEDTLAAALRGDPGPRAVMVSGPAGIGKSRLMRELVWRAQLQASVFEGAPQQGETARHVVERALGRGPVGESVLDLLAARDELARSATTRVLALDGIDLLSAADRALLEALVRATQPTDSVIWLLAGPDAFDAAVARLDLALGPLDAASTRAWSAPFVTAARPQDILRVTGGHPGTLRDLCADLARGVVSETDLDRFADSAAARTRQLVARLPEQEARLLATMALAGRVGSLDAPRSALDTLEAAGLARLDGRDFRLARPTHARELLGALSPGTVRDVARQLAGSIEDRAERARYLVHAGEHDEAGASCATRRRASSCRHRPAARGGRGGLGEAQRRGAGLPGRGERGGERPPDARSPRWPARCAPGPSQRWPRTSATARRAATTSSARSTEPWPSWLARNRAAPLPACRRCACCGWADTRRRRALQKQRSLHPSCRRPSPPSSPRRSGWRPDIWARPIARCRVWPAPWRTASAPACRAGASGRRAITRCTPTAPATSPWRPEDSRRRCRSPRGPATATCWPRGRSTWARRAISSVTGARPCAATSVGCGRRWPSPRSAPRRRSASTSPRSTPTSACSSAPRWRSSPCGMPERRPMER